MTKEEVLKDCEHVGIVQTAINPVCYILVFMVLKVGHIFYWLTHFIFFFRTIKRNPLDSAPMLPGIFSSCILNIVHTFSFLFLKHRIGGTVSLINTGDKDIYANMPVYWDVPNGNATDQKHSACGQIKGHPEGIIYPSTKMLDVDSELEELWSKRNATKNEMREVLQKRRRVIGWSLVSIFYFFYVF